MSLRTNQSIFALNVSKLLAFGYNNGYEFTFGEAYRPRSMQLLYFCGYKLLVIGGYLKLAKTRKRSKTMFSKHLKKLAIDLNVFKDGKLLTERDDFKELAEYWKSLHTKNTCGYFWRWDMNHFQMTA